MDTSKTRSGRSIFWVLAAVLVLALAACGADEPDDAAEAPDEPVDAAAEPGDASGELVISVWGGTTEEFFREHVEPRFNELYPDVELVYDIGGMSDRYNRLLIQEGDGIDLFVSTTESLFTAIDEGLIAEVDEGNVANLENLEEWAVPAPGYGAAYSAIAYGLAYDPEFFGDDPPTSWDDLWRPEVQGRIAVPAIGHSMMLYFITQIAEIEGGSVDEPEPGLERLADLDPAAQTFFYTDWNAQYDAGDVVLATEFDYYVNLMAEAGSEIEFVIPEEGAFGSLQHLAVSVGAENQPVVEDLINLLLSPEVQELVASDLRNAPARSDIEVPADLEDELAVQGDSFDMVQWRDEQRFSELRPSWTELMNQQVAPAWGD